MLINVLDKRTKGKATIDLTQAMMVFKLTPSNLLALDAGLTLEGKNYIFTLSEGLSC